MGTQRYISTSFWDDKWIRSLDPAERYLYMYLLTNPQTNIAGIYPTTIDRIAFDTGYDERTLRPMLSRFEKAGKAAFFREEYVVLPSWPKHQKAEEKSKIRAGIEAVLKSLPKDVLKYALSIGYQYPIVAEPGAGIGYTYPSIYSDSDLDLDSDLDSDTDKDSDSAGAFGHEFPAIPTAPKAAPPPSAPAPSSGFGSAFDNRNPGATRLAELIAYWNSKTSLPRYRHTAFTMRQETMSDALKTLSAYSDEEIKKAIDNYATMILAPSRYEVIPEYPTGFAGFMRTGVESYCDEAKPFQRCEIKSASQRTMGKDELDELRRQWAEEDSA